VEISRALDRANEIPREVWLDQLRNEKGYGNKGKAGQFVRSHTSPATSYQQTHNPPPSGAYDTNGRYYPSAGGGNVWNTQTGAFLLRGAGGYLDTSTGRFIFSH